MSISIKLIPAEQTHQLRHKVLWPHKKLNECNIPEDLSSEAFHVGVFNGSDLATIASFYKVNSDKINYEKQYRLRAMATDISQRRNRFGEKSIQFALQHLAKLDADVLWCDAREIALNFYRSLSFNELEETYNIPIIGPHKFMYYDIKKSVNL